MNMGSHLLLLFCLGLFQVCYAGLESQSKVERCGADLLEWEPLAVLVQMGMASSLNDYIRKGAR